MSGIKSEEEFQEALLEREKEKDKEFQGDVLRRYDALLELFDDYKKKFGWRDNVFLNERLLLNVVYSYFYDLHRFKEFHNSPFADNHKKAAYTIKWISRLRPIQLERTRATKIELLANELYAVHSGLSFLKGEIEQISTKFLNHLLYQARYRHTSGLALATNMYSIERAINKEAP